MLCCSGIITLIPTVYSNHIMAYGVFHAATMGVPQHTKMVMPDFNGSSIYLMLMPAKIITAISFNSIKLFLNHPPLIFNTFGSIRQGQHHE